MYVELEAAHEELLVRAQETEAECRRWREGDERKRHRRERERLENERDALRDENDALRVRSRVSAFRPRESRPPLDGVGVDAGPLDAVAANPHYG